MSPDSPCIRSRNPHFRIHFPFTAILLALICLLLPRTWAQTTISGTVTVTDPASYFATAGTITLPVGTTLQVNGGTNPVNISNPFILSGGTGTMNLKSNGNERILNFTGTFSSNATAPQTLAIATGYAGNGDRAEISFDNGLPNASGGSPLAVSVLFAAQTASFDYVNLKGANTFTGNITLTQGNASPQGFLTVGGRTAKNTNTSYTITPGSGSLAPNYPGNVSLGNATTFIYASSAAQNMTGVISGVGAVRVAGSGGLTLSGVNTYTGNTTVDSGASLVLGSSGGMKFVVTNSSSNKITGAGSATLNGTFTLDTSAVTSFSGSWPLVDTTTKTFGASFALTGFTGPVGNIYTMNSAGKTWTFDKSTGVLAYTANGLITSFGIPGSTGVINQTNKTIALTVSYTPWGLNGLGSLAPTYTLTSGTCNQTSGFAPSPTFAAANPATYTVTDGAVVNNYTVTVSVTPASTACAMLTCDFGALGTAAINETSGTVILPVAQGQSVTSLAPTFTLSPNASISPASGSTRDFTNPVVYRVTAEDGTTYKDYTVSAQSFSTWAHSGSIYILTTPDGANLPAGATVTDFPLLLRFNSANFNFAQALADGGDVRFSTTSGIMLPYEIEVWDSVGGKAAVWIRIPTITGNTQQEIKMHWGKPGLASQSNGAAVFNASNGYCSVLHLNGNVQDATGSISPVNGGATPATALIGTTAMNLATGSITASNITNFPSGTNPTSTGQLWIKARKIANWAMPLSWSNTGGYGWGTWLMQIGFWGSPSVLPSPLTCRGPRALTGATALAADQWYHVVYTNTGGNASLYINGALNGTATGGSLTITNPQALSMNMQGGDADVDEARISNVSRSADWVKLEYENQKPMQTLAGGLVPSGSDFSVSPNSVTLNELSTTTLTAQAGGARKVYWIYKKSGQETVLATDQLTLNYSVGRITGNESATIQFKAVFPTGTQTIDVPITAIDTIPDPAFTLTPSTTTWDGRQTMTVTANITNLAAMQTAGFGILNYKWTVGGVAVSKQENNGTLTLTRAQGSGPMTVSLAIDNGGMPVSQSALVSVQQPASDPWVQRTPDAGEKPVNKQFFARDPNTELGTIFYNGTQTGSPDTVYLKVYKTPSGGSETLHATHRQPLAEGAYAFTASIPAGLVTYRVVYGTTTGGVDTDVATVNDLVCGDAFIIEGQSNALATDNTAPSDTTTTNPWIRTYGLTSGWGYAISKGNDLQLGLWGWYLANRLVTNNNMPICIINGAVGGTRIDQHRPNPAGHGTAGSLYSIYANLYNRVVGAKLTHGIRGLFWHQGEQDQGVGGPDGDYNYKFYQQYFLDISSSWKGDFPNLRNYWIYQIWPGACGDTSRNDQLREVQRTLPRLYSNMKIMSTLGTVPGSSCHYEPAGYQVFSDRIGPLVEQDVYGSFPSSTFTAPNLQQAYFTSAAKNEIALVFDQNVLWNPGAPTLLFLANSSGATSGSVTGGSANGNTITLQVSGASAATTITYVKGSLTWQQANLLTGSNGIAALTFADVAIGPAAPTGLSATGGVNQVSLAWSASSGATSYKVKRSTSNGGPYSTIATTASTSFTDLSVVAGTTYYYVVSATNTTSMSSSEGLDSTQASATPPNDYNAWINNPAQGLTVGVNDSPLMDPDGDGLENILEFVLSSPPMSSSASALPAVHKESTQWVFEYARNDASTPPATTQIVQYSDNLSTWTDVVVPATSSGNVTVTQGSPSDQVRVVIPDNGTKVFVRLKVIP